MSPLSWAHHGDYTGDELDRIIDWASSRCDGPVPAQRAMRLWEADQARRDARRAAGPAAYVEQPSLRERLTHRAHRLVTKDARAADTAGRLTTHGGHHE